jgi:hypothetical protein
MWVWVSIGAFCTAMSCVPLFLFGNPGPLIPLPVHTLLLVFVLGRGVFFVLPILFTIQFLVLSRRQNFLQIQMVFLMILWALTPLYFGVSWGYGLRYMGPLHTYSVFTIHILGLAILSGLAWIGFRKRSSSVNNVLNILLSFFIFWGAFPFLGELP